MNFQMKDSLGFRVNQVANKLNNHFNKILHPFDIAVEQRATLEIIKNDANVNQSVIASVLGKDKTTISRSLNSLEKKGLIIKDDIKNDRRINMIKLTEKGESVLEESLPSVNAFRENINSSLTQEELQMLFNLLEKVSEKL